MHFVIGKASHPLSTPPLPLAFHPGFGPGCPVRTHGPGSHRLVRTAWTLCALLASWPWLCPWAGLPLPWLWVPLL